MFNNFYKLVTVCASTKLKDEILEFQKELELEKGYIVLGLHIFSNHDNINLSEKQIQILKDKHKQKISLSDKVYVLIKDNYIGENVKEEIDYAESLGKEIIYKRI